MEIQDFALWGKLKAKRAALSFDLEITARCNNDCRHCYINLPAGDLEAKARELTLGEPLLREDFKEIYRSLKPTFRSSLNRFFIIRVC